MTDPAIAQLLFLLDESFDANPAHSLLANLSNVDGRTWSVVPPGLCITLLVLAVSMLGYLFEEYVNPRLREQHACPKLGRARIREMGEDPGVAR